MSKIINDIIIPLVSSKYNKFTLQIDKVLQYENNKLYEERYYSIYIRNHKFTENGLHNSPTFDTIEDLYKYLKDEL